MKIRANDLLYDEPLLHYTKPHKHATTNDVSTIRNYKDTQSSLRRLCASLLHHKRFGNAIMKQRFSSLDVKVIAHELNAALPTLRVTNIYDLSSRIFLVKLHAPNRREQLVIDSGFRCHLTSFVRTTAAAPSAFVQRLRKFLKTRRVTKVSQIGTDRIIELQFSEGQFKLYLEFYASGNIVLTDADLTVIALQRNVSEGEAHEQLKLGLKYNLEERQNYGGVPELTAESVKERLSAAVAKQKEDAQNESKKAKFKTKGKDLLRKSLAVSLTQYPPMLLDHGMSVVGFDKETSPEAVLEKDAVADKLMQALQEAKRTIDEVISSSTVTGLTSFSLQSKGRSWSRVCKNAKKWRSASWIKHAQITRNVLADYRKCRRSISEKLRRSRPTSSELKRQRQPSTA